MSITLLDVKVILGLPIDGEILVGPTGGGGGGWRIMCEELGFQVSQNDNKILVRQRILINWLLERIAELLPDNATKIQIHQ